MTLEKTQEGFRSFPVDRKVLDAIEEMGFTEPTPIQKKAIPSALKRKDLLACAGTGTGKTAAFGIPIIDHLLRFPEESAMIIAPTRELAIQISKEFQRLSKKSQRRNLIPAVLIGGMPMKQQLRALRNQPRLIIGTPGRILDHIENRKIPCRHFTTLVLDEADRMLDMGFRPQLSKIVESLPKERQTLLFSATLPPEILKMAVRYLKSPLSIDLSSDAPTRTRIEQTVVEVNERDKKDQLLDQINLRTGAMIVFVGTKRRSDQVARFLKDYGLPVSLVHGGRTQGQRNRSMSEFRLGKTRVLVATDVAARGIDVPSVEHVINFDLPQSPEDYVHRIGRTARAGESGTAVCILSRHDRSMWKRIMALDIGAPKAFGSAPSNERPSSKKPFRSKRKRNPSFRGGMAKKRSHGARNHRSRTA